MIEQQKKHISIQQQKMQTIDLEQQKQQRSSQHKNASNINVYVRIRPFNSLEKSTETCIQQYDDQSITIALKQSKQSKEKDNTSNNGNHFIFNGVFEQNIPQLEIYDNIGKNVIDNAFRGINGTIFCYGQTSSGKTYTCVGDLKNQQQFGLLPRLAIDTLQRIDQMPKNIEAKIKISMVEIYNQKIRDLIDVTKQDLKIRANKKDGIFLENVTQRFVLTQKDAFLYIKKGIQNRAVNATNMNACSSRSHLLFIITLSTHDIYTGQACCSKISLVDLAGSQKISKTGAEGKVLEEAKKINTSLTALGKVIHSLSDHKNTHVPYRQSKLTRLLQESLGGNCLTNLIVNVSPSSYNQSQTLTSIRFGARAKSIKNQPKVNKSYTTSELLVLLAKAQKTISEQNGMIKQLSNSSRRPKRHGGYGTLPIAPRLITMHLLPDQDETQGSQDGISISDCNSLQSISGADYQTQKSKSTVSNSEICSMNTQIFNKSRVENQKSHFFKELNNVVRQNKGLQDDYCLLQDSGKDQICFNAMKTTLPSFRNIFRKEGTTKKVTISYENTKKQQNQSKVQISSGLSRSVMKEKSLNPNHLRKRSSSIEKLDKVITNLSSFENKDKISSKIMLPQDKQNQPIQLSPQQKNQSHTVVHAIQVHPKKQYEALTNLAVLKQNLVSLKLRLLQQKKQNAFKSYLSFNSRIIIKRKNGQLIKKVP